MVIWMCVVLSVILLSHQENLNRAIYWTLLSVLVITIFVEALDLLAMLAVERQQKLQERYKSNDDVSATVKE